jgi:hypothetical protein
MIDSRELQLWVASIACPVFEISQSLPTSQTFSPSSPSQKFFFIRQFSFLRDNCRTEKHKSFEGHCKSLTHTHTNCLNLLQSAAFSATGD